jgi:hypothetical protein
VGFLDPLSGTLKEDYGLERTTLDPWQNVALEKDRLLLFCVGGTEEVFTQCSQNLFVKRPLGAAARQNQETWPSAWSPSLPLEYLLDAQYEIFQITVSASGLPGVSLETAIEAKPPSLAVAAPRHLY